MMSLNGVRGQLWIKFGKIIKFEREKKNQNMNQYNLIKKKWFIRF